MTALCATPVRRIINAIADAAQRWSDADFAPRVRVLDAIHERTGYSTPVVEYALDRLFDSLHADAFETAIANELGSLDALDQAQPRGRVCVISSRTTIGVALVPALFALCAKCDVLVKDREDALVQAFFATLAEELAEFSDAARASQWRGEDDAVDLSTFDAVVAFGTDATLARIRERLASTATFIGYGPKISIGYVARESLNDEKGVARIARDTARDLVLYDTEGCLSLRVLFVERRAAITPLRFAENLAREVERAAIEFPLGERRDAHAAAQLARLRDLAPFREAEQHGRIFSDANASYALILDPPSDEALVFLPRALTIIGVEGPADALAYIQRHRLPIEAIAITDAREDITAIARAMGAHRTAAFGDLQQPQLSDNHGGRPRIAEFIRAQ